MSRTNLSDQFTPEQRAEWKPRIIKRNTFRYNKGGEEVIRLHGTDIVVKHADGSVTLNSGGWQTVTTKDRMGDHLKGARLYSEKGQWYLIRSSDFTAHGWKEFKHYRVPYYDGIRVPQCFEDRSAKKKGEKREAADAKLRAQVRKFVARINKMDQLPEPGAGDCFYCQMHVCEGKDKGKPLGEAMHDLCHIRSHLQEGYLHGSLIMNALKWAGYRDSAFIFRWSQQRLANGERELGQIKRSLKRYLYRQLGLVS